MNRNTPNTHLSQFLRVLPFRIQGKQVETAPPLTGRKRASIVEDASRLGGHLLLHRGASQVHHEPAE
jgi:hypothetical protein